MEPLPERRTTAAEIEGDRRRLGQVFDNLISNALKFTPADGTVSVTTGVEQRHLLDRGRRHRTSGSGRMTSEHLFDRFYRSSEARRQQIGGVGLGLSIVDAIVSAHHGEVQARERARRGFHLHGAAAPRLTRPARHR